MSESGATTNTNGDQARPGVDFVIEDAAQAPSVTPSASQSATGEALPSALPSQQRSPSTSCVQSKESISTIMKRKLQVQLGMMTLKIVPTMKRLVNSIATVIADATRDPADMLVSPSALGLRDHMEHFEVSGVAGELKPVSVAVQRTFQTKRICATDSFSVKGRGTRIINYYIANDPQFGLTSNAWTEAFADREFESRVCDMGLSMTFMVQFVETCKWECDVFGKAVDG